MADKEVTMEEIDPRVFLFTYLNYEHDNLDQHTRQSEAALVLYKEAVAKYSEQPIHFINDVSSVTGVNLLSAEARKNYLAAINLDKVGKIALVGMNKWLKEMMMLFAPLINDTVEFEYFDSVADSRKWISEEQ